MNEIEERQLKKIASVDYEIYPLLKHRYSPRIFSEQEISSDHLKQLFEAVRWSASSNNVQPWRFVYARKGSEAYQAIFDCLSNFNQKWAGNAPVLIVTAYKEKKGDGVENFHALHDLGLALGNMSLQAEALNIGLHHMAGVDWEKAQKQFSIPEGFHVTTVIAVGYYGGELQHLNADLREAEQAERERMPQHLFAFENEWKGDKNEV